MNQAPKSLEFVSTFQYSAAALPLREEMPSGEKPMTLTLSEKKEREQRE